MKEKEDKREDGLSRSRQRRRKVKVGGKNEGRIGGAELEIKKKEEKKFAETGWGRQGRGERRRNMKSGVEGGRHKRGIGEEGMLEE